MRCYKNTAFFILNSYSYLLTHMSSEVSKMIQLICDEKGLSYDVVMDAVESAMGAAYRKDFGNRMQNIKFSYDPETGDMKAWDVKEVVEDIAEDVLLAAQEEMTARRDAAIKEGRELTEEETADLAHFNPKTQMMITQAKEAMKKAKVGETIEIPLEIPGDFGRMAAQTAKQVIIQKLREAEREIVFEDFKKLEGTIVQGTVSRRDRTGNILVDLGKINGIIPAAEQVAREQYRPGAKMACFVSSVSMSPRGPEIVLSRSDKRLIEVVFSEEIPEVESGEVVIRGIARDAGNRAKVAVSTDDSSIDPIGACIGQRGSRITTVIERLGGEKIDMIEYSDDQVVYIKNALSPAKVAEVALNESDKTAKVSVAADQFSLAIGRGGQNVRLAAALTGWTITVEDEAGEVVTSDSEEAEVAEVSEDAEEVVEEVVETPEVVEEPAEEMVAEGEEGTIPAEAPEESVENDDGEVIKEGDAQE
jgi:transcription termination/antitermination protein NusA